MSYKLIISILISFLFITLCNSAEHSTTFIVEIYGNKVRVVSPRKYVKDMSIIIKNRSLQKQVGKLVTNLGRTLSFITIYSNKTVSKQIKLKKNEKAILIPLAPASQKIHLIAGKDSYEIPPRKKY